MGIPSGPRALRRSDDGLRIANRHGEAVRDAPRCRGRRAAIRGTLGRESAQISKQATITRKTLEIEVDYAFEKPSSPVRVNVQLNDLETAKLAAMLSALRKLNREFAPGQPIDSYADVWRYVLSLIGDPCRPTAGGHTDGLAGCDRPESNRVNGPRGDRQVRILPGWPKRGCDHNRWWHFGVFFDGSRFSKTSRNLGFSRAI